MKQYDAIVIGSGCGSNIVDASLEHGLKVALVDRGPIGGTCPNLGCIPSKMLIYPADRIMDIRESQKLGINTRIDQINFEFIMERMRQRVTEGQKSIRRGITETKNLDFYEGEGYFTGDYTMEINGAKIKGKKIFIASGSRPLIPPLKGLAASGYLTNETLLQLTKQPDSLIIIGGGYIAVEYGHFFAAMGSKVTIIEMADRLILSEEPEIAALLEEELRRRMEIHTGVVAEEVKNHSGGITVITTDRKTGRRVEFTAEKLLVAVGRKSNADMLKPENTGVALDERGFIKVNEYLETTKSNIWAVGDINGQQMFTHVANAESTIAAQNALHGSKMKMDYSAVPHAVFSYPQIASVGMGEAKAKQTYKILVGKANYFDTARGEAMAEEKGFAKAIVDKETEKILGFHIIGPEASTLVQEVINAMASGGDINQIAGGIHIHPAMPELIVRVFDNLQEVN